MFTWSRMVPLTEGAADSESRAAAFDAAPEPAPDTASEAPSPAVSDSAAAARLDRRLNLAVGAVALVLVALAGWFGYSVWAQNEANKLSSPAQLVVEAMRKQVDAKPDDPTLHSRYAEALGAVGRFDEAKQQLFVALKLDPKYVGAYENLALVEILQKDYAPAEQHLNKVLDLTASGDYGQINERRELAYFHLGEISLIKRRYEDSVGYFKAALRIRKDASDTYVRLAQAYLGMDLKDQAKKQLQIALAFDPRFAEAHYELGKIYLSSGDKVNAAWEFRAALDGAPQAIEPQTAMDSLGSYDSWWEKAVAASKVGKTAEALDAVKIARAIQPSSFEAAMLHGQLLEQAGDQKGAEEAYGVAVKIKPDDKTAAAALSRVTKASGKKATK
jgi:tetratricopeptide (TPR) repeat protein